MPRHLTALFALLFTFIPLAADAAEPVVRLSLVSEEATPETDTLNYFYLNQEGEEQLEILNIHREPIVTDEDVEKASVDPSREGYIHITLTKAGAAKMREATARMELGKDRMAVIVDGKVKTAPTVNAVLGNQFMISGLADETDAYILGIVSRLNHKTLSPWEVKQLEDRRLYPEKYVHDAPYTEEEYLHFHANLKRIGLHFLMKWIPEDELTKILPAGKSAADVIKDLGKPRLVEAKGNREIWLYELHSDHPEYPKKEDYKLAQFTITFHDKKVVSFSCSSGRYFDTPSDIRAEAGRQLKTLTPLVKDSADLTYTFVLENSTIINPEVLPTTTDLSDLISQIGITFYDYRGPGAPIQIEISCPIVQYLAKFLPELKPYRGARGKIDVRLLNEIIAPYEKRTKRLPELY